MKHEFTNLDVTVFEETLDNGLKVFVIPMKESSGIYGTITTKYGSINREFIPNNEREIVTVPDGIAHFLEHKMFEQEQGEDPFTFFGKRGTDCNANTSNYKTTYLFAGPDHLKDNLKYLLKFVREPYFTDENVEKEKGIIEQEIEMNDDEPGWKGTDAILQNAFHNHPIRIPIPGTVESIKKITKEDLYLCYNTFYQPANMFVVVSGDVEPEEVFDIVKKEQKNDRKLENPIVKTYEEPDEVVKEIEKTQMNVTIPKLFFAYKFNIDSTKQDLFHAYHYLSILAIMKFGPVSEFLEKLKQDKLVTEPIDYELIYTDKHILLDFFVETKYPEETKKRIEEEMLKDNLDELDFKRKQKTLLSSCIYMSDDIYQLNHHIMNDMILEGKVNYDIFNTYKNMSFEVLKEITKNLNYQHTTTYIIEPKNT